MEDQQRYMYMTLQYKKANEHVYYYGESEFVNVYVNKLKTTIKNPWIETLVTKFFTDKEKMQEFISFKKGIENIKFIEVDAT